MAVGETNPAEGDKVVAEDRQYLIHSWSVQSALNPIAVAGGEGRYFWDYEGKRYLDFASQLVNLSLGHEHPRIVAAITRSSSPAGTRDDTRSSPATAPTTARRPARSRSPEIRAAGLRSPGS